MLEHYQLYLIYYEKFRKIAFTFRLSCYYLADIAAAHKEACSVVVKQPFYTNTPLAVGSKENV